MDLDSFLVPFLDELNLLREGVPAYDAHKDEAFILKAHLVLATGDTPAISKLMYFCGHMAKFPCRACKIEGIPYKIAFKFKGTGNDGSKTQYYYPLQPPTQFPHALPDAEMQVYRRAKSYNSNNLPLRTHLSYQRDGQANNPTATGIKGISPLFYIPTISIPLSCPFDVMHLIYLGFVRDLCALINGSYFKHGSPLNNHDARIRTAEWEVIGREMGSIEAPSSWGRAPRDIAKYIKSFKAEDLSNFLTRYMLPLFCERVPAPVYRALQQLVLAMSLATGYEIENPELDIIERLLKSFTNWFYDTFYHGQYERLPVCKYTVHALLHLPREIRNWGPASYFWQYAEVSIIVFFNNCCRNGYVAFLYVLSRVVCGVRRI